MDEKPVIDREKCTGCGLCASVCAIGALNVCGDVIDVAESCECDWCLLCEAVCPTGAISCPFEIVFDEPQA